MYLLYLDLFIIVAASGELVITKSDYKDEDINVKGR